MQLIINAITRKYATFSGRARRSEYWYFVLCFFILGLLLVLLDHTIGTYDKESDVGFISTVFYLALLVPSLAVAVRRLHDADLAGWWILVSLVPIVGFFIFLFMMCKRGTVGENRFGPDPFFTDQH